jgi:hypothetical protein
MISSLSEAGYLIPPHPRSCFFEQPQFQGPLGDDFLQRLGFLSQIPNVAAGRCTRDIHGQPSLPSFQELFRPVVIQAPGNVATAQLRDAVLPEGRPGTRSDDGLWLTDFCLISTP